MRILQVLDSYPPDLNGGAYFTHRLSRQLVQMGHEVLVVCPSRGLGTHYDHFEGVPLLRVRSYPAVLYGNFRVCWPLWIRGSIESAIDRFQPQVIHLQGRFFLGNVVMWHGARNGIPMVVTNHFMPDNFFHYTGLPERLRDPFNRKAWAWVKEMFDLAQVWSTPTASAASLLRSNGFVEKPIHAVSCGVDLERFFPRPKSAAHGLNVPQSSLPTILYAGRLDKEKNLPLVLQAVAVLQKTLPCRLLIVGTGARRSHLESLAESLGISERVHFSGYLTDDDYPLAFALGDCFVHAGTAELQSIVTLEALASGLPIVAARAVALPELVDEQRNGFLFDAGNVGQLCNGLLRVLGDPFLNHQFRAHSRTIASRHSLAATASTYCALYHDLV